MVSRVSSDSRISASSSMISTDPVVGDDISPALGVMTAASDMDSLPRGWELEIERRAPAGPAFHFDLPGVLLNDSVGDRQPQPRAPVLAFARSRLGGEERIVNAVNVLLRDSRARIRHYHADSVSVGGSDAQRPAAGHGILGIQEQVQKHLLQP